MATSCFRNAVVNYKQLRSFSSSSIILPLFCFQQNSDNLDTLLWSLGKADSIISMAHFL